MAQDDFTSGEVTTPEPAVASNPLSNDNVAEANPTSKGPTLCGICNLNPSKYKCPRCRLPYCSVACNKIHRDNHPPVPEPAWLPESKSESSPPAPEARKSFDSRNPFGVLDTSDRLRWLFTKYPSLPTQLQKIYSATQPPPESATEKTAIPASLLKGLPPKKDSWNHDVGIQKGKEALRYARRLESEEGEGVREYCNLITHMLEATDPQDRANDIVRERIALQDVDLIQRLMEQEQR